MQLKNFFYIFLFSIQPPTEHWPELEENHGQNEVSNTT